MSQDVSELLKQALALPAEARAALLVPFSKALTTRWTRPPKRNGTKRLRAASENWMLAK